jgi:ABC-type uncharacterized transport system permease subunit
MKKTAVLFQLILKNEMAYMGNFFSNLFLIGFIQVSRFFYIDSLFSQNISFGSWGKTEAIFAFFVTIAVSFGLDGFFSSIAAFSRKVYHGQIDPFLCKPVSISFQFFLSRAQLASVVLGYLFMITAILFYHQQHSQLEPAPLLALGSLGYVLAVAAGTFLFGLVSLSIFWFHRTIPVDYIFSQLYKMNMVPGAVFSPRFLQLILLSMPVLVTSTTIVSAICFGKYEDMALLAVSCIILGLSFLSLFQLSLKRSPSFGG